MLDQAFGWLGQVAEFIGSLFPRLLIVKTSDRALKYIHGHRLVLLPPGLHLYWPLVTEVEWCSVVRTVVVHKPHVLETRDGVQVTVGGVTTYRVSNPIRYLAENEAPAEFVDDLSAAAIRQVVVARTYAELQAALPEIDEQITSSARELLRPFGVRVESTRLTDFARTRTLHLTGTDSRPLP